MGIIGRFNFIFLNFENTYIISLTKNLEKGENMSKLSIYDKDDNIKSIDLDNIVLSSKISDIPLFDAASGEGTINITK